MNVDIVGTNPIKTAHPIYRVSQRNPAVVDCFIVGVANVATQDIDGKCRFLNFDCVWSFLEIANHVVLLAGRLAWEREQNSRPALRGLPDKKSASERRVRLARGYAEFPL